MNSKRMAVLVLGVATAAGVGISTAQEEDFDPVPVIEGRQSALRDIGSAFKEIGDELKKAQPSIPLIRQYANQIDDLVQQQKFWFPPGTGPETEVEMKAKAEVWKKPAEFKAGQTAFAADAAQLAKAAAGSDTAAMRTQWQALGRTCRGCHDKFREEDD